MQYNISRHLKLIDKIIKTEHKVQAPLQVFIKDVGKDYFYLESDKDKIFKSDDEIDNYLQGIADKLHIRVKDIPKIQIEVVDNSYLQQYMYE